METLRQVQASVGTEGREDQMKAAIYARVSTQEQGDGYSIPAQVDSSRKYAEEAGAVVVGEYVDIGYSGGTTDRPNLTQMLVDAKAGEFDIVVCRNPDRLARGVEVFIPIQTILTDAGVRMDFVEEQYRDDPMSQAMLQIRQVIAGVERKMTAIRVHGSKAHKSRNEKVNATPKQLYGYEYDPATQTRVVNEQEAHWLHWAFGEYVKGRTPKAIAYDLNTVYCIPTKTRSDKGWDASNLSELFKRTEYIGEGWANRYYFVKGDKVRGIKGKVMERPRSEWIRVEYPSIIERDLWDAAQARREKNTARKQFFGARPEYLLLGKLWCTECGTRFMVRTIRPSGKEYRYYKCGAMIRYPHRHNCRDPKMIRAAVIEDQAWDAISRALSDPFAVAVRATQAIHPMLNGRGTFEAEVAQVSSKLQELAAQRSRLVASVAQGILEDHEVAPQIKAIREQVEHWTEELGRLQGLQAQEVNVQALADAMLKVWAEWLTVKEWTFDKKRQAITDLVDRVTVNKAGEVRVELAVPSYASDLARP